MIAGPDAMIVGLFGVIVPVIMIMIVVMIVVVAMAVMVVVMGMSMGMPMRVIVTVQGMVARHGGQSSALPL
jgi:hypothetical protein